MFVTLNYTYSAFKNTIVGTISGNAKDWVFKVNVDSGTVYNDSYKVHLTGTSGSFNVRISTVGGAKNAEYSIELTSNDLVKYYTDSACTNLIENNIYNGNINSNTSSNVTIYYKASSSINDDVYVKVKGNIMEVAMMKNGYSNSYGANGGTEFWNNTYKKYIRTITFGNDLSNLPSNCTEENLCWDISDSTSQKKKVYGYLIDSGLTIDETDSSTSTTVNKTLYNLYIVSEAPIFAPANCEYIFSFYKYENGEYVSNLTQINFNNFFNTSNVTNMGSMFRDCSSLANLDLSSFNTSNVTNMLYMFYNCSSLTSLDLSIFNTSKVTDMSEMFDGCSSLTSLDLSSFNTSNVTNMQSMFSSCTSLTNLSLSNFNTSNVTNMQSMFSSCTSLTNLSLSNFNTSKVADMNNMFYHCSSLTSLNLSNFDTSKVTNMKYMFALSNLKSVDLSSFNTSNVTDMNNMFYACSSLTNLDLSSFNTSKVTTMMWMFYYCSSLTNLDLSSFNTSKVTNMYCMFSDCSSLTSLDLSSFDTSNVTNMDHMFWYCSKLTTTINIMNPNVTSYSSMFTRAATSSNAKITVNYTADTSTLVDQMIATQSPSSKVVKGTQI